LFGLKPSVTRWRRIRHPMSASLIYIGIDQKLKGTKY
jgi:hypothetical protein